jgi:hypothetical protein
VVLACVYVGARVRSAERHAKLACRATRRLMGSMGMMHGSLEVVAKLVLRQGAAPQPQNDNER